MLLFLSVGHRQPFENFGMITDSATTTLTTYFHCIPTCYCYFMVSIFINQKEKKTMAEEEVMGRSTSPRSFLCVLLSSSSFFFFFYYYYYYYFFWGGGVSTERSPGPPPFRKVLFLSLACPARWPQVIRD